jgi:hypothetical protein
MSWGMLSGGGVGMLIEGGRDLFGDWGVRGEEGRKEGREARGAAMLVVEIDKGDEEPERALRELEGGMGRV